jgi:hypothetical protein
LVPASGETIYRDIELARLPQALGHTSGAISDCPPSALAEQAAVVGKKGAQPARRDPEIVDAVHVVFRGAAHVFAKRAHAPIEFAPGR